MSDRLSANAPGKLTGQLFEYSEAQQIMCGHTEAWDGDVWDVAVKVTVTMVMQYFCTSTHAYGWFSQLLPVFIYSVHINQSYWLSLNQ